MMNNSVLKQLADVVRQERAATAAYEAVQARVLAQEEKDAQDLATAKERISTLMATREGLLDQLVDDEDNFESVTVA